MKFGAITHYLTGVAVPVSSIRTEEGCGIGEFLDLIPFGTWCKKVGLDVIQILPINDTGRDTSPYNALTAFALHPIYIRLQQLATDNLEIKEEFAAEIKETAAKLNALKSVNYNEVGQFKLTMLKKIYTLNKSRIQTGKDILAWCASKPWLKQYAVYRVLKDLNEQKHWQNWSTLNNPSGSDIDAFWDKHTDEVMFYAWIQYELELQLTRASKALEDMGLRLKGDIPILINEDSADVWAQRQYFDLTMRAGAPPDMFSDRGQNWRFPCYNWTALEKDDYKWWRQRLKQAANFYHVYRIDHVLGFFRIWQIPEPEHTGVLGSYEPASWLSKTELNGIGIDDDAIQRLVVPTFTRSYLRSFFGNDSERIINSYFTNTNNDNYVFADKISSENLIMSLSEESYLKDKLLELYWDRVMLTNPKAPKTQQQYQPTWFYYKTRTFNNLHEGQRRQLNDLIERNKVRHEEVWKVNGKRLLKMMAETTDMLVCAEDLGAIPDCVPGVLAEMKILGLRIERWSREYSKHDAPYIPPAHYPRLSVASPSVHDTSTLRGLWEEPSWDRNQYFSMLGLGGGAPNYLTTEIGASIIRRNLGANSLLTIILLPDLLSLYYNLRTSNPDEERINVPGTYNDKNWTYRMKDTVNYLIEYNDYNMYIKGLIDERHNRPLRD
ncbi:4-alpha-glucanotransferase [Candidatus Magnetobacterium bavaricum]|uniref:4-alpha-glucanotransferase n=1 Tax=Candidatus Magnetobacterium bavaricum TaxID=29290 RepID=A0A0F3GRM5_9BACT|nr:4-alpha-glucanotransferase [Candidatus Magnetobacterium bavaricum]